MDHGHHPRVSCLDRSIARCSCEPEARSQSSAEEVQSVCRKPWEHHGKTKGKPWENAGLMEFDGIYPLVI